MKKIFLIFSILFLLSSCFQKEYKTPKIVWEDCMWEKFASWFEKDDYSRRRLLCANFEVPLDYSNPNWEKITLALTKYYAWNDEHKWNLLVIPGWPWGDSYKSVFKYFWDNEEVNILLSNFNVIWYAPRWVSPSKPEIDCWDIENKTNEEIIQNCLEKNEEKFLKNLSSNEAFEDIEQIRLWLWEEKISAIAYSHWTKVLAMYAEKYWQNLRAWVFDWVVNLEEDVFTELILQNKSFQEVFEKFVDYCLNNEDYICIFDKEKWDYDKQFIDFLKEVWEKNLLDYEDYVISSYGVLDFVESELYNEYFWHLLVETLAELKDWKISLYNYYKGLDYSSEESFTGSIEENNFSWIIEEEPLKEEEEISFFNILSNLSNTYFWKVDDTSIYRNNRDIVFDILRCSDDFVDKKLTKEQIIENEESIYKASSYNNIDEFNPEELYFCYSWPFDWKFQPRIPKLAEGSPKMLFVTHRYDPATPYENAVKMAKYFNSPLLTRNKIWHSLSFSDYTSCINEKILEYLLEPEKEFKDFTCEE